MTAPRRKGPRHADAQRGRSPVRVLAAVLALFALTAAVWLALVGRRAATSTTPAPLPRPAPEVAPTIDEGGLDAPLARPETGPIDVGGLDAPGGQDRPAEGTAAPAERPDADTLPDASAVEELSRVSGLGRRSAEALVAGGITSLADLAGSNGTELAAVVDAAGIRRSTALATWPNQARRLLEG